MAINVPSWLLDLHEQGVDAMLNSEMGNVMTVTYAPIMSPCANCTINPIGNKSSNIHRSGGPVPFPMNSRCPVCDGEGYKQVVSTDVMTVQVRWQPKDWLDAGARIRIPDGHIQIKGYMTDVPKLRRCLTAQITTAPLGYVDATWQLASEPAPHGFRNNRYFLALLKRV